MCGLRPDLQHPTTPMSLPLIRVLVVEDDFGDYDAVARALKKMTSFDALVTRAKTLVAARKLMAEHDYDVLLLDFNLGPEFGTRLLEEIGGRGAKSVAILLTGLANQDVHDAALRSGAIGMILKEDLSSTVLENTIRYSLYTHRLEAAATGVLDAYISAEKKMAF